MWRFAPGTYDIGGPDRLTFEAMTERLGELQGHPRPTLACRSPTAGLEGAVAALVTDQDRELLTPLMAGLDNDLVVADNALRQRLRDRPDLVRRSSDPRADCQLIRAAAARQPAAAKC